MNPLENCLLLAGLPIGMILAGFWLAAPLSAATASERLAVAALAGLATLLWNVAAVNFFRPLSDTWVWLCLWPVAVTLLSPVARRTLVDDVAAVVLNRRGLIAIVLTAAFFVLLLWPLLTRPTYVFYDGTSNHDAFFWISSAEHLKRHTYMQLPVVSATHALNGATPAIIGWHPTWGRMGAEGLLAFTSSLVGLAPVKLYLCATATLLIPWIAAIFLVTRTFLVGRLGLAATVALIAFQPVFIFFHANANLPNLLGALMAAAVVIATERSLRPAPGRAAWLALLALGVHGLLCSYPEIIPFVVMPGGLLWLRAWFAQGPRAAWRPAGATALAWIAGAALNPASSVRAWSGFMTSFDAARANQIWANMFEPLSPFELGPALATLAFGTSLYLGVILGAVLTLALGVGVVLALRRAPDRTGALFTLAGVGALVVYTSFTGFKYGWQKTVQFGGAFWVAFLPVAVVDVFASAMPAGAWRRRLARTMLVAVFGLFALATVLSCLDGYKWARRKIITQDWFTLREYVREQMPEAPVLVDGSSFSMAFFHGMWATYFLADNPLYFAARGEENGGYLRSLVAKESKDPLPAIAGILVSRAWADTIDANSPRLMLGDTVALLKAANQVKSLAGFYPEFGPPNAATSHLVLEIEPHSRSELSFELTPNARVEVPGVKWSVTCRAEGAEPFSTTVSGPPPWRIAVPLAAHRLNRVELTSIPSVHPARFLPFEVQLLKIRTTP